MFDSIDPEDRFFINEEDQLPFYQSPWFACFIANAFVILFALGIFIW